MEILSYKDASQMPDHLLPSLVDSQIECWGAKPFDEYKKCNDCHSLFSIEDIHGSVKQFRSEGRAIAEDFCCIECGGETEFFYKPEEFIEVIKEYIKGEVSSVLLVTPEEKVEGFGVISKTTLGSLLEKEFNTRPKSYHKGEILRVLSQECFGVPNAKEGEIICLHQIYTFNKERGTGISFQMLQELFSMHLENVDTPILLECRFDNNLYPIMKSMGFRDIICDKHGYVVQCLTKDNNINTYVGAVDTALSRLRGEYRNSVGLFLNMSGFLQDRKIYA